MNSHVLHDYDNVQPRLSELRAKGLVRDSGKRGLTLSGKACIMWEVV